jgi:tetraacyldisaccharide 4'-kinase
LADASSNAEILVDEFFYTFKNIQVAVDAIERIQQLLSQKQKPEVILLDDAYQHRKVKAGFIFYLLMERLMILCSHGNLRESRRVQKG